MGPRTGSPAAETRKNRFIWPILLGVCLLAVRFSPADAATEEVTHQVTVVVVPPSLSFSESEDVSLNFQSGGAGSESEAQTVSYWIKNNNASRSASEGVLTATLQKLPDGIELTADSGSFTNHGPAGGVNLTESASGFQLLTVSEPVSLADQESSVGLGTEGSLLKGQLPVTWKAKAAATLSSGDQPIPVTITLKES